MFNARCNPNLPVLVKVGLTWFIYLLSVTLCHLLDHFDSWDKQWLGLTRLLICSLLIVLLLKYISSHLPGVPQHPQVNRAQREELVLQEFQGRRYYWTLTVKSSHLFLKWELMPFVQCYQSVWRRPRTETSIIRIYDIANKAKPQFSLGWSFLHMTCAGHIPQVWMVSCGCWLHFHCLYPMGQPPKKRPSFRAE